MHLIKTRKIGIATAAIAAVTLGGAGWAYAATSSGSSADSGKVFYGCVSKNTGALRVVAAKQSCHGSGEAETRISWNQTGVRGVAGARGAQGKTGTTGKAGAAGSKGDTGTAGATIVSGAGAPSDSVGNNGDYYFNSTDSVLYGPKASDTWPSIGTSLKGVQGVQGVQGATGANGTDGTTGAQGPKGDTGATGATGANGTDGNDGATGAQGPKGDTGATGATGANGSNGNDGAAGAQGPKGDTGATGATGANGTNGTNGHSLLGGPTAPTSAIGNDGDFYLNMATGTLYGPKSDGAWPTSGMSLVGPQGPKGDTGTSGAAGSTGAAGAQGPKGDTGATGAKGDTGATGSTGPAGPAGSGGATLTDKNGNLLGTVVSATRTNVALVTTPGYLVSVNWDGFVSSAQIYWTGPNCTGTPYLNSGATTASAEFGKSLVYSGSAGTLLAPASVNANETATSTAVSAQSFQNGATACAASTTTSFGWQLATVSNTSVGLPTSITAPLALS